MYFLNKGLNFCLQRTKPSIDEMIVDTMALMEKLNDEEIDEVNVEALVEGSLNSC